MLDRLNQNNSTSNDIKSSSKYMIFSLKDNLYCMPLSMVKEVISLPAITKVPDVPNFIRGIINLRGQIISIIDMRKKLNMPAQDLDPKKSSIIISQTDDVIIGAIVDDVIEVRSIDLVRIEEEIDSRSSHNKYISGIIKTEDEKLILLVDLIKIFNDQELFTVKNSGKKVG
ncbi:MAG: chemotaxis protein CheW [Oligoflexales bacterium]